jgi:hypothetical protein
METTMTVDQFETRETRFDAFGTDPEFEAEPGDSVREAYEFLGAVGFGRDGTRSLAVDMIELS